MILLDHLQKDAWFPEHCNNLLRVFKSETSKWKRSSCIVFPESGCGYFEWKAVAILIDQGWCVDSVIFMEPNMNQEWRHIWNATALELHVNYTAVDSYKELYEFILQQKIREFTVIYINGSFCFSKFVYSTEDAALQERYNAVQFWNLCETRCCNAPKNFLSHYEIAMNPCQCGFWKQLALALALTLIS